jgi:hypothetical protein
MGVRAHHGTGFVSFRQVDSSDHVREPEKALDAANLAFQQQKQISHGEASSPRLSQSAMSAKKPAANAPKTAVQGRAEGQ